MREQFEAKIGPEQEPWSYAESVGCTFDERYREIIHPEISRHLQNYFDAQDHWRQSVQRAEEREMFSRLDEPVHIRRWQEQESPYRLTERRWFQGRKPARPDLNAGRWLWRRSAMRPGEPASFYGDTQAADNAYMYEQQVAKEAEYAAERLHNEDSPDELEKRLWVHMLTQQNTSAQLDAAPFVYRAQDLLETQLPQQPALAILHRQITPGSQSESVMKPYKPGVPVASKIVYSTQFEHGYSDKHRSWGLMIPREAHAKVVEYEHRFYRNEFEQPGVDEGYEQEFWSERFYYASPEGEELFKDYFDIDQFGETPESSFPFLKQAAHGRALNADSLLSADELTHSRAMFPETGYFTAANFKSLIDNCTQKNLPSRIKRALHSLERRISWDEFKRWKNRA